MLRRSLLRNLLFALIGMLVTVIVSFTLVADAYFRTGIDTLTSFMIRGLHTHYAPLVDRHEPFTQPQILGFSLATSYDQLPDSIRQRISADALQEDQLRVLRNPHSDQGAPLIFLMKLQTETGHEIYYTRIVTQEMMSSDNLNDLRKLMAQLLLISATALLLSILILILLYIATSRPLRRLIIWTRELGPSNVSHAHPDFGYADINQLANLVQSSLRSAHDALAREHEFLRHASHELRTPLAVISSNLQLLNRFGPPRDEISQSALERITRATNNMSQLSETLLWLSREDNYQPGNETVQLDRLITELVDANRYLILGKGIEVESELAPCSLFLPPVPCRIVLGNLIRNACQHAQSGVIHLHLTDNGCIEIRNDRQQGNADPGQQPDGFGLGLELVGKLCNRFAWQFEVERHPHEWIARLTLHTSDIVENKP